MANGDFTAYVCYSAATRPSSQITLDRLVNGSQRACEFCNLLPSTHDTSQGFNHRLITVTAIVWVVVVNVSCGVFQLQVMYL